LEYTKSSNVKEKINNLLSTKLKADTTYISRFVYKKLGDKTKYLQSTMITTIINKLLDCFSSYYALLNLGMNANKPKYLKPNEKFNLIYFYSDIVVNNNILKMYTSNYLSKNFSKEFTDYVQLTNYKYVHKKYLSKINKLKIKKKSNYIYNDYYIDKLNKYIIDSRYIVVEIFRKLQNKKIKMIEIKPVFGTFKVILTYENEHKKETKTINIKSTNVISIDLGVNNLMTIYNPNGNQYIISGGPLKSLNYYISKKISKYQRLKDDYYINKYQKIREDKINDYFNRIVKWLTTEYSSEKLIIIGYNKGWKDKSNMGKKSNLIFNKIPFMKLINKIKMKFNVLLTEESYTSKCDGLALEDLSKQESYSGKRINRGLFKSSTEKIINADLNGAINIMRKQIKLTKITGYRLMSPKRIQIYSMMFNPVDNVH